MGLGKPEQSDGVGGGAVRRRISRDAKISQDLLPSMRWNRSDPRNAGFTTLDRSVVGEIEEVRAGDDGVTLYLSPRR
jgi:hypothetical protein